MVQSSIGQQQVLDQLQRILSSEVFKPSKILCDFLKYIVTETVEGRSAFLKEYTVGVNGLFKKNRFDPQSDASVRIHAGRLRKLLQQYYETEGSADEVLISLPKGTYVPVFAQKPDATDLSPGEEPLVFKPTLAVLPFTSESSSPLVGMGHAICDQLCTDLTAFNEIAVVSYYSSRQLAESVGDLRQIGQALDATHILTGQIQSIAEQVRIRVQLTAVSSLQQIWAKTYDVSLSGFDALSVQDDIVNHIINQVAGSHGAVVRDMVRIPGNRHLLDVKVYDAVFWFYYLVNDLTPDVYQKALGSVKIAVQADKRYALGWAILGEMHVAGFFYGYDTGSEDPLAEAVRCSTRALDLDPHCHHAYQSLGLAYLFRHDRESCLRTADRWLGLKVNVAGIAGGLGFCLICAGRYDQGYRMLNDSINLNPFYPWWFNAGLSIYYYQRGEWQESAYWADKMRHHHMPWTLILLTAAKHRAGQRAEAEALRKELHALVPADNLKQAICAFILSDALCESLCEAVR